MTYDLVIGDRAYSSWSLRGWLLFDAFDLPVRTHLARLYSDALPNMLADGFFPGRTAPTMRMPDGVVVPETIAIAEELASRHPDAGIWPADPKGRATARVAFGHDQNRTGFTALVRLFHNADHFAAMARVFGQKHIFCAARQRRSPATN